MDMIEIKISIPAHLKDCKDHFQKLIDDAVIEIENNTPINHCDSWPWMCCQCHCWECQHSGEDYKTLTKNFDTNNWFTESVEIDVNDMDDYYI